jgi:hypothetical protein
MLICVVLTCCASSLFVATVDAVEVSLQVDAAVWKVCQQCSRVACVYYMHAEVAVAVSFTWSAWLRQHVNSALWLWVCLPGWEVHLDCVLASKVGNFCAASINHSINQSMLHL